MLRKILIVTILACGQALAADVSVMSFGAKGDCSTNDSPAIIKAIAAGSGNTVLFPAPKGGCYKLGATLGTIPANTRLQGANKQTTKLKRAFNGTQLMQLADGVSLDNLYLEGDGANFSGKGIIIASTDGNQSVTNSRIINFNGNPVEFTATTAGSRSNWDNIEAWQTGGTTGTGKYAFVNADAVQALAIPKRFTHIETAGNCSFDLGGSADVFITDSFIGDLNYSANTKGVQISATRIANQTALTLRGANNTIVGSDVLPAITIAAGSASNVLGPNSWNTVPYVTDSSGADSNLVFIPNQAYTPTLSAGGVAPVLGNATLTGEWSRSGVTISYAVNFTKGGTTTLGTGELRFSLPQARVNFSIVEGTNVVMNGAGTLYTGTGQIPGNVSYVALLRDTSGAITFNSPAAWGAGDTIRITGSYTP